MELTAVAAMVDLNTNQPLESIGMDQILLEGMAGQTAIPFLFSTTSKLHVRTTQ
jgi:hypothetical protein